jgi:Ca-activated chloride channel family protein
MIYNRGNTLLEMGKPAEAAGSYLQALQYLPNDFDARHNLELALRMVEQQQQQQQQQQQDSQQNQEENQDQDQRQESSDDQQEGQQDPGDQRDERSQPPDSTVMQPPDSSAAPPQPPDSMATIELSREDALRILKLLEEQEKELQKEKRKAAFKRVRRSGKDW